MLSAREAYALCTRFQRHELQHALVTSDPDHAASVILKATIASLEGDVRFAEAIFVRALATLDRGPSYAYVVDSFVPMLISRLEYTRALAILEHEPPPAMEAAYASLRATAFAQAGDRQASQRWDRLAVQRSSLCDDEIVKIKITGRGAVTAYYLGAFDEAVGRAKDAVTGALGARSFSMASRSLSLLVNVAFSVFGDAERARGYALQAAEVAALAKDASLIADALSYQLEIAAARGDVGSVRSLRRQLAAGSMGLSLRQRMPHVLSEILLYAWAGNFDSVSARSEALRAGDRSQPEAVLCTAFMALAAYARNMEEEALAIASSVFEPAAQPAPAERHFASMARIIAAHVEIGCGRRYAGKRHVSASSLRDVPEEHLARLVASQALSEEAAPSWLSGYVRAMLSADSAAAACAPKLGLSVAERNVLSLFSEGLSAKLVASTLGLRTPTVRTHVAAIARRLGTHTIIESIAEARHRGFL